MCLLTVVHFLFSEGLIEKEDLREEAPGDRTDKTLAGENYGSVQQLGSLGPV